MSTLFLTCVLSVSIGQVSTTQSNDLVEPRAYHEISKDMRDLMKRESLAKTDEERATAIRALADLYLEVKRDPRLDDAPTLAQYKAKLWSRLTRIKKNLERQIARENDNSGRDQNEIDAQQAELQQAQGAGESLAAQMTLVSYSMGGPAKVFAESGGGAFGGGAIRDHGEELVELITHVIEPDFWDVNGGPGSIFYYAPLQALVVRATGEVHRKLGGGIGRLRAAGP